MTILKRRKNLISLKESGIASAGNSELPQRKDRNGFTERSLYGGLTKKRKRKVYGNQKINVNIKYLAIMLPFPY